MKAGASSAIANASAAIAVVAVVIAGSARAAQHADAEAQERQEESPYATEEGRLAPLLDGIGDLSYPVTTSEPMAQRFFDQGLTLTYAFNHLEAARSFEEAARIDPECAMCRWGRVLALGPNINDPAPGDDREDEAYAAMQKAKDLKENASEKEQAFIEALATRYAPSGERDRARLNQAYAEAMAKLYAAYPEDDQAAILYAAALMNTMPWDYWDRNGQPREGTETVLTVLEQVKERSPGHPGAHHYYIHAVEASDDPDRAVASADRLGGLVPVAGHLVHMPSHIYIRVGRYADASEANVKAIAADEHYVTQCRAQGIYPVGYYPHNIHFLWFALTMEGRSREAIEQARKVASRHEQEHFHQPGFGFPHLLRSIPLFTLTRFARWDEILDEPEPPEDRVFVHAIWSFARGMAFRAKGEVEKAEAELQALKEAARDPSLEKLKIFDINSLDALLAVAVPYLEGEIAAAKKDWDAAVAHLRDAIEAEDSLKYSEPKDWPLPSRQALGGILLQAGRFAQAEKVFREDLKMHRDNGWSLYGLAKSLEEQGKTAQAETLRARLKKAWARSDVDLSMTSL